MQSSRLSRAVPFHEAGREVAMLRPANDNRPDGKEGRARASIGRALIVAVVTGATVIAIGWTAWSILL
jgi:hypothetical protein